MSKLIWKPIQNGIAADAPSENSLRGSNGRFMIVSEGGGYVLRLNGEPVGDAQVEALPLMQRAEAML